MGGRTRGTKTAEVVEAPTPAVAESSTTEIAMPLPGEAKLDKGLVDEAVSRINRLYTGRSLEMAREIGEYVLDTFFGGDANNFRTRGGEHASFKALSEREDMQFSKIWLWRAVSLYDQLKLFPKDIAEALPYIHHTVLLGLHDEDRKVALATTAVEKNWTKDKLQEEVSKARQKEKKSKGGRKALPPFVKTVNRLEKFLASEEEFFSGLDQVEQLEEDEADRIKKVVKRMKAKLDQIVAGLDGEEIPDAE